MAFTHKDWKDDPDPTTPLSAANLEDLEDRVTDYADAQVAVVGETVDLDTGGAVDQASALQTAIDNVDSQGGGKVLLPATNPTAAGTGIRLESQIEIPQYVNLEGCGVEQTEFRLQHASAGLKWMGVGDTPSGSRGGWSGGFTIEGSGIADLCFLSHAVNRNFFDIKVRSPQDNGGIAYKFHSAQNNNCFGFDGEDSLHSDSGETYGIVFDAGTAGNNFYGLRLNEFTGAHVLFDATATMAGGLSHADNICFYGNMIERTDTGSPIIHVKAGTNIHFDGGNITGELPTPVGQYDLVLIDNTAALSYTNIGGGGSPTTNVTFANISFWGEMDGSTKYANVFHLETGLNNWTKALDVESSCSYTNCKYLALIEEGSAVMRATAANNNIGSGFTDWTNPAGAGKPNTRIQSTSGTLGARPSIDYYELSGTTTITSISATYPGHRITLLFTSTAQVTDGGNIKINGNFTGSADRTLTLVCDGTNWYETGRSAN